MSDLRSDDTSEARAALGICRVPAAPTTGRGVRVAVIDSGWDRTIYDSRVSGGTAFVDCTDDFGLACSTDVHDRIGHGTAVTDLLLQVAPAVTVVPIRVFYQRLETSLAVLLAAIEFAVARQCVLVNLSVGTLRDDTLRRLYLACDSALRSGTIIVAAADGIDGWSYPAVFTPVLGVGHKAGLSCHEISYQADDALEFGACAIGQSARGLGGVVRSYNGASFAAPIVVGHLARFVEVGAPTDIHRLRQWVQSRANVCAS